MHFVVPQRNLSHILTVDHPVLYNRYGKTKATPPKLAPCIMQPPRSWGQEWDQSNPLLPSYLEWQGNPCEKSLSPVLKHKAPFKPIHILFYSISNNHKMDQLWGRSQNCKKTSGVFSSNFHAAFWKLITPFAFALFACLLVQKATSMIWVSVSCCMEPYIIPSRVISHSSPANLTSKYNPSLDLLLAFGFSLFLVLYF